MRRWNNRCIDLTFFSLDATYVAVASCQVVQEESLEHSISRSAGLEAYNCTNSYEMRLPEASSNLHRQRLVLLLFNVGLWELDLGVVRKSGADWGFLCWFSEEYKNSLLEAHAQCKLKETNDFVSSLHFHVCTENILGCSSLCSKQQINFNCAYWKH